MKKWIKILIPVVAVAAVVAWYAFRPERLFVNRRVGEALPTGQGGLSARALESGRFYSILHPTEGTATIFQMGDGARILRLTSFITSNGPDVHVYMVAADDAKDVAAVQQAEWVQRVAQMIAAFAAKPVPSVVVPGSPCDRHVAFSILKVIDGQNGHEIPSPL